MFPFKLLVITIVYRAVVAVLHHFRDFLFDFRQEVVRQRKPELQ